MSGTHVISDKQFIVKLVVVACAPSSRVSLNLSKLFQ
jgi:hypothetical protein